MPVLLSLPSAFSEFIKVNIFLSNFTAHIQIYALTNFTEDVTVRSRFAKFLFAFHFLDASKILCKLSYMMKYQDNELLFVS
jgi:hypothetical protein